MKTTQKKVLSDALYIVFNVAFAVFSIFVTVVSGSWILGALMVFLAKWRIFAMSPRRWAHSIEDNAVDLIVGVSFVVMAYLVGTEEFLSAHYVVMAGYSIWLAVVKSWSGQVAAEVQSLVAVFLGFSVLGVAAMRMTGVDETWLFEWEMLAMVVVGWFLGYSSMRHLMVQSGDDEKYVYFSVAAGLIFAEIAWILYHFGVVYVWFGIWVPQMAIILTLVAFVMFQLYRYLVNLSGAVKRGEIILFSLFSVAIISIIIMFFS